MGWFLRARRSCWPQARAADRLREQEERLGARASDAVEQALEERDTARRDAETARAVEARANELLRVSAADLGQFWRRAAQLQC